jgi:hypothetical protein
LNPCNIRTKTYAVHSVVERMEAQDFVSKIHQLEKADLAGIGKKDWRRLKV